jgi:hypothetical protein
MQQDIKRIQSTRESLWGLLVSTLTLLLGLMPLFNPVAHDLERWWGGGAAGNGLGAACGPRCHTRVPPLRCIIGKGAQPHAVAAS